MSCVQPQRPPPQKGSEPYKCKFKTVPQGDGGQCCGAEMNSLLIRVGQGGKNILCLQILFLYLSHIHCLSKLSELTAPSFYFFFLVAK